MNVLADALRKDWTKVSVPVPWDSLSKYIRPLRGNLIIVLGAPGQGKSALALNWLLKAQLPGLMLSLDTDLRTQALRTAAVLSSRPLATIQKDPAAWSRFVEKNTQMLRTYDVSLETKELNDLVKAETEYWGEAPAFTVVDNVSNMLRDGGYEEHRSVFLDLHRIARGNDTCVIALHHIKRANTTDPKLTLHSGQYAGEQEAEIVLGLWSNDESSDFLKCSVLKNRTGNANAYGHLFADLKFTKDTMQITDVTLAERTIATLGGAL